MSKNNELLKRLETALLKKPWAFKNLTRLREYLTNSLPLIELYNLTAEVEATIASWSDADVIPSNKFIIRAIMDNVLRQTAEEISGKYLKNDHPLTHKMRARLSLAVSKTLVTQLTRIVAVQPMKAPLGLLFMLQYKKKAADTDNTITEVTLDTVSQAVESTTRRLRASRTIDVMQDMMHTLHTPGIEDEMTRLLANEISGEIIGEVISDLLRLGKPIDLSGMKLVELSDTDAHDAADKLMIELRKAAADIAFRTRRGAANYIIIPLHVVSILQGHKESRFKQAATSGFGGPFDGNHLIYVGNFERIKVYTSLALEDQIIVGYKGGLVEPTSERKPHECDAGYFFLPFQPVLAEGIVTNPDSFQKRATLMTRYGKAVHGDINISKEHYRVITLDSVKYTPVPDDFVSDQA